MIPIIDLILVIVLAGFIFYGLFFGLIRTFGSLATFLAGLWVSVKYYIPIAVWLNAKGIFFGYFSIGRVIVFLILFALVNRLVALGFSLLERTFNLVSIIPFLKTINRLTGAIFGFLLGMIILGLLLNFFLGLPFAGAWLAKILAKSKIMPYLVKFVAILKPLFPAAAGKIKKGTSIL